MTDSKVARDFVTELDTSTEVASTPNSPRVFHPDWAIAFQEGMVKHVYFVAVTKGSLSSLQLKGAKQAKIECARMFFAELSRQSVGAVSYDVVTDYAQLRQLVGT